MPNKDGLYELVRTLNSSLGEQSLREKVLEQVFETYWPHFEKNFKKALEANPAGEHEPPRSEESILSEILRTIRSLDRRVRSIEGSVSEDHRGPATDFIPSSSLRKQVLNMTKEGASPEMIEEFFHGKVPRSVIRNYIISAMRALDDGVYLQEEEKSS